MVINILYINCIKAFNCIIIGNFIIHISSDRIKNTHILHVIIFFDMCPCLYINKCNILGKRALGLPCLVHLTLKFHLIFNDNILIIHILMNILAKSL